MILENVPMTIQIGNVKELLENGYEIEVESPDGFIPVNYFVEKGMFEEYKLVLVDGREVKCNENHLFETREGWQFSKEISESKTAREFLTDSGYVYGVVYKTGNVVDIVDINVQHENHRYYTNGISSHNTNAGKSHLMTYFSSQYLMDGLNVLYVTLEMAEIRIAERIDAALLDVAMDDLKKYPKTTFGNKLQKLKQKTQGKLIIKEYPTGSINANNIRFLLDELKTKKNFVPDVIVLDYLNLVGSYRIRDASNTYATMKNVAEELRGLAVEKNVMLLTATQTNRAGQTASDFELTEVSESHGVSMTADSMFGLIVTEDLEKLSQMRVKILKNRYGSKVPSSFVIGMNRQKMSLHDLDKPVDEIGSSSQQDVEDTPALNTFGGNISSKSKLSGFKV